MSFVDEHKRRVILATDGIVDYKMGEKKGIILIERLYPPHGYALPGGKQEYGLTLSQNVIKEIGEETNLAFTPYGPPLCERSAADRDPRYHVISITFAGRGEGEIRGGDDAKRAFFVSHDDLELLLEREKKYKNEFAFKDHPEIIGEYLTVLRLIEQADSDQVKKVLRQFTGTWVDEYWKNQRGSR